MQDEVLQDSVVMQGDTSSECIMYYITVCSSRSWTNPYSCIFKDFNCVRGVSNDAAPRLHGATIVLCLQFFHFSRILEPLKEAVLRNLSHRPGFGEKLAHGSVSTFQKLLSGNMVFLDG